MFLSTFNLTDFNDCEVTEFVARPKRPFSDFSAFKNVNAVILSLYQNNDYQ